jgi:hypothetical protein
VYAQWFLIFDLLKGNLSIEKLSKHTLTTANRLLELVDLEVMTTGEMILFLDGLHEIKDYLDYYDTFYSQVRHNLEKRGHNPHVFLHHIKNITL